MARHTGSQHRQLARQGNDRIARWLLKLRKLGAQSTKA